MIIKPPLDLASASSALESSQRILILGAPGSGKSYWGKKLSKKLCLPLISLDHFYWKPGWQPSVLKDFQEKCHELAMEEEWIMEGNFGATFDSRWSRADLVIYLDPNPYVSYARLLLRMFGLGAKIQRPIGCREWRGLLFLGQIFWLTFKFANAHGKLISEHMRQKYPGVSFVRVKTLKEVL